MATNPEKPIRNHYLHAGVPEHVDDLRKQVKKPQPPTKDAREKALPMQAVIFVNRHAKRLLEALGNPPNDPDRLAAEKAVRGFARAVEKPKGVSINAAARELNVPQRFLWSWAREKGIIPILVEGSGSGSDILIDRDKAQEVAEIYREAKLQHVQPIKLYQRKYPK